MSYLIAATDFTDVANNAVHYACRCAGKLNVSVQIVHSFTIPVNFGENPMPVIPVDESREIAEERMGALLQELRQAYPGLVITGEISFGDILDNLGDLTEDKKPLMVIIGNSGTDDQMLWMGSNVLSVMRHLRIPVVAIPMEYAYQHPYNICYACDYKYVDPRLTEDLLRFVRLIGAKLHVLHVDFENKEFSPDSIREHRELYQALLPLNPVYHHVQNQKAEEGIYDFILSNDMDMLIVVPHKQSFWTSLFHKSLTKAMVKTSPVPIVALHEAS